MAAIGEIVVRSWQHTFSGLLPPEFLMSMSKDHQARRHEKTYSLQGMSYQVAVAENGQVIGFASGGPARDTSFGVGSELYAIYLRPDYERRRIGRRLFEAILTDMAASGRNGLYLTALAANRNRAFYSKLGGIEIAAPKIQLGDTAYEQVAYVWRDLPRAS